MDILDGHRRLIRVAILIAPAAIFTEALRESIAWRD